MKYGLCAVLLGSLAVGAIALMGQSARSVSKPVVEHFIDIDTAPPPRTASDLARDSEAVVIARYTGKARVIDASANGPMETHYTFEVLETIKPSSRLATNTLEISIPDGDKDFGDHIERTSVSGSAPLAAGLRYVVFLRANTFTGALYLAYNTAGLYDVSGPRVRPVDSSRDADANRDVPAFLSELRQSAKLNGPEK